MSVNDYIDIVFDIVFDGPPGPESGRFVEVENQRGSGIKVGKWINRKNGTWALRIPDPRRIGPLEARLTDMDNAMQAQIDATGRLKTRLGAAKTDAKVYRQNAKHRFNQLRDAHVRLARLEEAAREYTDARQCSPECPASIACTCGRESLRAVLIEQREGTNQEGRRT